MGASAIAKVVQRVLKATDWNDRVEEVRRVPELFGERDRRDVYAAIAEAAYKPTLAAQFAYVQWRAEYELEPFEAIYAQAYELTDLFEKVDPDSLTAVLMKAPRTVLTFRSIIGYRRIELAVAATEAGEALGLGGVTDGRIAAMEAGRAPTANTARAVAEAIHRLVTGSMWDVATGDFRSKLDKPDTTSGWDGVREMARHGVPYSVLLHQRHYGGAFRTLLDATGTRRGEVLLEEPVAKILADAKVPHIRTGAHNQQEIRTRFGLTVQPAPDFVVFEGARTLRAMIECKQANDGGTARDKAGRFGTLAQESSRLGGVPLFAVLDGLGWERTTDALGPVVRYCAGRVFTLATLPEILTVEPFPGLIGKAD